MKAKTKRFTKKEVEETLIRTVAAFAMLQDCKTKKKKPRLSTQGFIINTLSGRFNEALEACMKFKGEAADFIERHNAEVLERANTKMGLSKSKKAKK